MAVMPSLPNEASIRRPVGAILTEQAEERMVQRGRYKTLATLATLGADPARSPPAPQTD
jgi:hypothetical protein